MQNGLELGNGQELELGKGQELELGTCFHSKWRLSKKSIVWGEDCSKLCGSSDIQNLMLCSVRTKYFCKRALGNLFVLKQILFIEQALYKLMFLQ